MHNPWRWNRTHTWKQVLKTKRTQKPKEKEEIRENKWKSHHDRITYVFIFRHDGSYFDHPWNQFDHIDESSSWAMNFTSKNHRNDLKYKTARSRYLSLVLFQKGKNLDDLLIQLSITCLSEVTDQISSARRQVLLSPLKRSAQNHMILCTSGTTRQLPT